MLLENRFLALERVVSIIGHMGDENPSNPDSVIDLEKRRMARDMEKELGGLFGIELKDIEAAIGRVWTAVQKGEYPLRFGESRLPLSMQRVIQCLELIYEIAREPDLDDEPAVDREHIIELMQHYLQRIQALESGHSD